ncbi:EcoRII N-terminal effector-binding domain-containing protein [Cohnella phaseoli]|uniref:EcoRII N-terminal effector-binding domain-containing protein n=1 Tax=Cohnella phaseoli TaxID=456490 RepID=UPI000E256D7D|nr:EcoRII N-terminal effector-binding domain-containing protein [Cohnella phaseoli]
MEILTRPRAISKLLSANDTGANFSHQAGILVPKVKEVLSFFPDLGTEAKNPRVVLSFEDISGEKWSFNFIYYNGKLFGGTRNEYRLTGMTRFIKSNNLRAGDKITFLRLPDDKLLVKYQRMNGNNASNLDILKLRNNWRVVIV